MKESNTDVIFVIDP